MNPEDNLSLGQAISRYLAGLSAAEKEAAQVEVTLFARWYGWNSAAGKLSPPQVAQYAERLETSVPDPAKKLEPVRSFLAYLKKQGITQTNLSVHLKLKKTPGKPMPAARARPRQQMTLTPEGRRELEAKLEALKAQRPQIVEAVQLARADKDFRENAPLDAAREHHAHVEAQIRELEDTLKSARVVEKKEDATETGIKVVMGSTVTLRDLASGQELRYTLVSPKEVSPGRGRVSVASPLGLALRGRRPGDEIEVKAPAGTMRYRIELVERR